MHSEPTPNRYFKIKKKIFFGPKPSNFDFNSIFNFVVTSTVYQVIPHAH